MRDQLQHVLKVSSHPNVSVRVIPYVTSLHPGAVRGVFTILDFPMSETGEPEEPPLGCIDTLTGAMYLDKKDEVDAYNMVWRDLEQRALDVAASRAPIESTTREYS